MPQERPKIVQRSLQEAPGAKDHGDIYGCLLERHRLIPIFGLTAAALFVRLHAHTHFSDQGSSPGDRVWMGCWGYFSLQAQASQCRLPLTKECELTTQPSRARRAQSRRSEGRPGGSRRPGQQTRNRSVGDPNIHATSVYHPFALTSCETLSLSLSLSLSLAHSRSLSLSLSLSLSPRYSHPHSAPNRRFEGKQGGRLVREAGPSNNFKIRRLQDCPKQPKRSLKERRKPQTSFNRRARCLQQVQSSLNFASQRRDCNSKLGSEHAVENLGP